MTSRPHDALFKAAFEAPNHVCELLQGILPHRLGASIAWPSLTREASAFIDTQLDDRHGDLLFSANFTDGGSMYLLIEHQSSNDAKMPLRVLAYFLRIWEQHARQDPGEVPAIVAVIVSHATGGWSAPTSFHELVVPQPDLIPELSTCVPNFSFYVQDLSTLHDDNLMEWSLPAFPKLALWLLRDARHTARMLRGFERWVPLLHQVLSQPHGSAHLTLLLRYVTLVGGEDHFNALQQEIAARLPRARENMMTIAEALRKEGLLRGLAEGRAEGHTQALRHVLSIQLQLKFGDAAQAHAPHIQAATPSQLERYIERILRADTLASVFSPVS